MYHVAFSYGIVRDLNIISITLLHKLSKDVDFEAILIVASRLIDSYRLIWNNKK